MRLFIAFDVPRDIAAYLVEVQTVLRKADFFKGTYPQPDNLHITVLFLGERQESDIPAIITSINKLPPIAASPLELAHLEINRQSLPSVVWIALQSKMLTVVFDLLSQALCFKSNSAEPFNPHITIARVKKLLYPSALAHLLEEMPRCTMTFQPEEIKLKQSQLTSAGAVYSNLYTYRLSYTRSTPNGLV